MATDSKYVVFKRDEFSAWYNNVLKDSAPGIPMALDDAVVLRTKDTLSQRPLAMYAQEAEEHQLWTIAEYFTKRAMEAEAAQSRLPD